MANEHLVLPESEAGNHVAMTGVVPEGKTPRRSASALSNSVRGYPQVDFPTVLLSPQHKYTNSGPCQLSFVTEPASWDPGRSQEPIGGRGLGSRVPFRRGRHLEPSSRLDIDCNRKD